MTIQALVRTISSASDEDLRSLVGRFDPSTGLTDNRLLPYYLELWTTVLTSDPKASETLSRAGSSSAKGSSTSSSKLENDAGETVTDLPSLQMVFNELMGNVVSIFHRLDLTFDASTEGDGIGEINSKGVPRNPKDCALFHNLVSMVESVLQVRVNAEFLSAVSCVATNCSLCRLICFFISRLATYGSPLPGFRC